MNYEEFIEDKKSKPIISGFDIDQSELNESLKDFQKYGVTTAIKRGRYALFHECGMGKTIQQLEWARLVTEKTNQPVLILTPLAVSFQTVQEGEKFGIDCEILKSDVWGKGIYVTNYEQLDNIDCSMFSGVVLDESSILKNFTGKIKEKIISSFASTPYKLACTATPSPNDPMELGNHSEFLGIKSRAEVLAMYFVHDGGATSKWRLKGHSKKDFYSFISSWSMVMSTPSDYGFSDDGYVLPPISMEEHIVHTELAENKIVNDGVVSATTFNAELRRTKEQRMNKAIELANSTDEQVIVWIKQNEEGDYLKGKIEGAVEVKGSDKPDKKEKALIGFKNGTHRVLITKIKIAQFGLNFQNCHLQIFASLDFSFEGLYQGIRRVYRFGQKKDVTIHIITTDTMTGVIKNIKNKEKVFKELQMEISKGAHDAYVKIEQEKRDAVDHQEFRIENVDCVKGIKNIPNESIGLSVFSPPFAELYTYSDHIEDMGNSRDYKEFNVHFGYLAEELFRVTMTGRNVAVHCMDLPIQKGKEGFIGLRDFSGMLIKIFSDAGFVYHSRITIFKDPVVEMQRTKALGLLHKQVKKNSAMSRVGIPDNILVFRKDGDPVEPVRCEIDVDQWQRYASPVWAEWSGAEDKFEYAINYGNTLNGRAGRHENDEKHICPLQLETIERLVTLYSNKGDTVLSPFMGIGSEGYQSIKMGRKFRGFELKESYFDVAVSNMHNAVVESGQMNLFEV